ncbi:hypothetical protein [Streptosporangium sp. NPDC006930]|uniref:hypothetical protein n=1 Tax=unclassified Streptosporangium TaxID=2632669 RepID=UPI00342552D9
MTRSTVRRAAGSVVIAIATLAAILVPVTPAHATYGPDQPVSVTVTSNAGPPLMLAQLTGTVAFDDGNTKFRYALQLCWGSGAYPSPSFSITVNGSTPLYPTLTGTATAPPGCQAYLSLYNGEHTHSTTLRNVTINVTGGWFYPGNSYNSRTKSVTYDNPYN